MLKADDIKYQINSVILVHPELAEDEILRADTIEGATDAFEFLAQTVKQIEDAQALLDGTHARIEELARRADRFDRRINALRDLVLRIMEMAGLNKKVELPCATLSRRNNPPKLLGEPAEPLPDHLLIIRKSPDRAAIKKEIESGGHVPGYVLLNGSVSLVMSVK